MTGTMFANPDTGKHQTADSRPPGRNQKNTAHTDDDEKTACMQDVLPTKALRQPVAGKPTGTWK
jgi:hypothetical protein